MPKQQQQRPMLQWHRHNLDVVFLLTFRSAVAATDDDPLPFSFCQGEPCVLIVTLLLYEPKLPCMHVLCGRRKGRFRSHEVRLSYCTEPSRAAKTCVAPPRSTTLVNTRGRLVWRLCMLHETLAIASASTAPPCRPARTLIFSLLPFSHRYGACAHARRIPITYRRPFQPPRVRLLHGRYGILV